MSNTSPVATGGTNSGSMTTVSTIAFPCQSRRAINQATATPSGRIKIVLSAATSIVKKTICHASAVTALRLLREAKTEFFEYRPRHRAGEILRKSLCAVGLFGRSQHGDGVRNLRPFRGGDFDCDLHLLRDHGIGFVDDARFDITRFDRSQRRTDVLRRHDLILDRIPKSELLEILTRVDAGWHGLWLSERKFLKIRPGKIG